MNDMRKKFSLKQSDITPFFEETKAVYQGRAGSLQILQNQVASPQKHGRFRRPRPSADNRQPKPQILDKIDEKFNPYGDSIDSMRKRFDDKRQQNFRKAQGLSAKSLKQLEHR